MCTAAAAVGIDPPQFESFYTIPYYSLFLRHNFKKFFVGPYQESQSIFIQILHSIDLQQLYLHSVNLARMSRFVSEMQKLL